MRKMDVVDDLAANRDQHDESERKQRIATSQRRRTDLQIGRRYLEGKIERQELVSAD